MMNWVDFALGALLVAVPWILKEIFVPDLLDRWRQGRAEAHAISTEERANEREDAPVRQRIAAAVLEELKLLQRVFVNGSFTIEEWQERHDRVKQLVDTEAGARVLGKSYQSMMQVIVYDQFSIAVNAGSLIAT